MTCHFGARGGSRTHKTAVLSRVPMPIRLLGQAGAERFERPSGLLESLILPLDETPSLSFVVTQYSAVVFSTVSTTSFCAVIRTYTEFTLVVGHPGIEPRTSELSALRANQLCQCPEASPVSTHNVTGHRETDYTHNVFKIHVISLSSHH